ncbi:hypothetical protein [Sinomonas humi]|uniref:hypothetical protein n=1 Tax=Sinomonas humi TaxID=1338436 RepID=UPI0012E08BCD|nr:hypothetical protein [Sinomonas humi]
MGSRRAGAKSDSGLRVAKGGKVRFRTVEKGGFRHSRTLGLAAGRRQEVESFLVHIENVIVKDPEIKLGRAKLEAVVEVLKSSTKVLPGLSAARASRRIASPLAEQVGPFYDTNALAKWLGSTRQAFSKSAANGKLLAVQTSDRRLLFPVWQFDEHGRTLRDFDLVLKVLRDGTDDSWKIGSWMTTPVAELEGESAKDWLGEGKDSAPVVELARQSVAAWTAG